MSSSVLHAVYVKKILVVITMSNIPQVLRFAGPYKITQDHPNSLYRVSSRAQ